MKCPRCGGKLGTKKQRISEMIFCYRCMVCKTAVFDSEMADMDRKYKRMPKGG